jgi:hypothetical protein
VGSHLRVDGDELFVEVASNNKPVICMHGTGTPTTGPASRTAALLETQSERDGRVIAPGSNRFRVEYVGDSSQNVIELCTMIQEGVSGAALRFSLDDSLLLVRAHWFGRCRPNPKQVEFSFARLLTLRAKPVH